MTQGCCQYADQAYSRAGRATADAAAAAGWIGRVCRQQFGCAQAGVLLDRQDNRGVDCGQPEGGSSCY